jgi:hypothetical protein
MVRSDFDIPPDQSQLVSEKLSQLFAKQVDAVRYIRSLRRVYFRKSQMQPNSVMRPYSDTLVIIVDL